jgi:hypothetical protein
MQNVRHDSSDLPRAPRTPKNQAKDSDEPMTAVARF